MVQYSQTISSLHRLFSIYSFTFILLACYVALLFIDLQRYDIPIIILTILFFIHIPFILFSKAYRIVKNVVFDDEAKELMIQYYLYGFFVKTENIPYNVLQYWVGTRGRLHTPPYGVRFYKNKKFIAEIQEYGYTWQPTQVATIVDKLVKVSSAVSSINKDVIEKIRSSVIGANRIYSLAPVYFKKLQLLIWVPFLSVGVVGFLYMSNTNHVWLYMIFPLILLAGIFCVFYLTRYELVTIAINGDNLSLEYFNRSFFKRKPFKGKRSDVNAILEENNIQLSHNNTLFAVVRNSSVNEPEWQEIREYFQA